MGGIVGGALIAGALFLLWRRRESAKQRTSPSGSGESEKRFASSPTSTSPGNSSAHNPYDEIYAPDNVEEETAGYNAQFRWVIGPTLCMSPTPSADRTHASMHAVT